MEGKNKNINPRALVCMFSFQSRVGRCTGNSMVPHSLKVKINELAESIQACCILIYKGKASSPVFHTVVIALSHCDSTLLSYIQSSQELDFFYTSYADINHTKTRNNFTLHAIASKKMSLTCSGDFQSIPWPEAASALQSK